MIKWHKREKGKYTDNAEPYKCNISIVRGDLIKNSRSHFHVSKWSLYIFDPYAYWVWVGEYETLRAAKAAAELLV